MNEDVQYESGTSSVQVRLCGTSKVDHQFWAQGVLLRKWKVTCCHSPILLLRLTWYTDLRKGCGMLFREITLALISL